MTRRVPVRFQGIYCGGKAHLYKRTSRNSNEDSIWTEVFLWLRIQMSSYIGMQMMRQNGVAREGSAVTIRYPSTAHFLVDSVDRNDADPNSGNFTINKPSSLFNGFFNRLALQEIVLDWGIPNIAVYHQNTSFSFTYDFGGGPIQDTVFLPEDWYTAQEALDLLVSQMNVSVGVPGAFVIVAGNGGVSMNVSQVVVPGGTFEINDIGVAGQINNLAQQIFGGPQVDAGQNIFYRIIAPRILPYNYLDFVSPQLTYNQKLKDADTSFQSRDVLYRWYLAWDNETAYDSYGFPILQGYRQFIQRRIIPFPKQILWNPDQPIGSITFQVYNNIDELVLASDYEVAEMEFQMTFLLSED